MCTVCGCGLGETNGVIREPGSVIREGDGATRDHQHEHVHADGTVHSHSHSHAHVHDHAAIVPPFEKGGSGGISTDHEHVHGSPITDHDHLHFGTGPAHAHAPGLSQSKMVQIERDILDKNGTFARRNRKFLADHGIFALNLVSSPGSGKTTLLVETIKRLQSELAVAVIEGDQQTSVDADRIRATGARAIQINTGKGCHLDASMVEHAIEHLSPADDSLLLIENVGNLVCPSAFDLGEAHKVVVLSVTEGEDKPLKYPDMFAASDLMLLNKVDLLPYLSFEVERAIELALRVKPGIRVIQVSATRGDGMDEWLDWLRAGVHTAMSLRDRNVAALQRRVAELEVLVGRLG